MTKVLMLSTLWTTWRKPTKQEKNMQTPHEQTTGKIKIPNPGGATVKTEATPMLTTFLLA